MLTTCRNGTWILEQPGGSVMEFYPPWRYHMNCHIQHGGFDAVTLLQYKLYTESWIWFQQNMGIFYMS